ncbi:unnamed protein product [Protopolystoma xenopodis]|uniref:Uncharacterized protein n=1 Tax=Protopolystoma xenopodis TaxID=117903 RepID=A0A3S5AGA0_9PLAT|nr:unnamed protein product [Protopolystoma xenopodis]
MHQFTNFFARLQLTHQTSLPANLTDRFHRQTKLENEIEDFLRSRTPREAREEAIRRRVEAMRSRMHIADRDRQISWSSWRLGRNLTHYLGSGNFLTGLALGVALLSVGAYYFFSYN